MNLELTWQWLGYMQGRLKGSRAKGSKPNKRGRNVSIIGAISVNEVLTSVNLIGTTDAITFEAFIPHSAPSTGTHTVGVLMESRSVC